MLAEEASRARRFDFLCRIEEHGLHEFSERDLKALVFFATRGYVEGNPLAARDRKLLAATLDVTERSTFAVLRPLVEKGFLFKSHVGRYVFYTLNLEWRP